jgi:hypothetical protein
MARLRYCQGVCDDVVACRHAWLEWAVGAEETTKRPKRWIAINWTETGKRLLETGQRLGMVTNSSAAADLPAGRKTIMLYSIATLMASCNADVESRSPDGSARKGAALGSI